MADVVRRLRLDQIVVHRNDRTTFDKGRLQELAESIRQDGLHQPILVRPYRGRYELVAGERRVRATRMLGLKTIRGIVADLDDVAASRAMLSENVERDDLNPIEEARAYRRRMTEFSIDEGDVAAWARVNPRRVTARLQLLRLRDDIQGLVATGNLPLGHAIAMVGLDNNRQTLALNALQDGEHMPTVDQFRMLCGTLLLDQEQGSMFDAESFEMVVENMIPLAGGASLHLAIDPRLPAMKFSARVGDALLNYIHDLQATGDPHHAEAALVVGSVLDGLVRAGRAFPASAADVNEHARPVRRGRGRRTS